MHWKQEALAGYMSGISEACWCAGWLGGTEYVLWAMVSDPAFPRQWGAETVGQEIIDTLKEISDEIGGWIAWVDGEERFVPMAEWLQKVEARKARMAGMSPEDIRQLGIRLDSILGPDDAPQDDY